MAAGDPVRVANKVKCSVIPNCKEGEDSEGGRTRVCEYLVYLSVPKQGNDGLLLGVTETEEAADAIASALNTIFALVHTHE